MDAPETQDLIDRFTCFIERVRDGVIGEQRCGNRIPWPLRYLLQERLGTHRASVCALRDAVPRRHAAGSAGAGGVSDAAGWRRRR